MRIWITFLLALGVGALKADEWLDSCGAIDPAELARDGDLIALSAGMIVAVQPGSVAKRIGLRVGDRLVGLDGLRIYGEGEWELVRNRRPVTPGEMQVVVWRDGAAVTVTTHDALPVQRLAFNVAEPEAVLELALNALATPACGWASFPRRAGVALLRWQAAAPPEADRAWIGSLATLYALLVDQRWAEAERLEVRPPDAELAQLAAFYHLLAARHAHGEQEPDPQCLGRPRPWYTIHYPYPRLVLPELGAFAHPDAAFVDGLAALRADPAGTQHRAVADAMTRQEGETDYAYRVRQAAVDGDRHGGWPYRHEDVYKDGPRRQLLAALRAGAGRGDAQADWSRFCLICPELIAHHDERVDEARVRPVLDLLAAVRARSPLLGYLGWVNVRGALAMWHVGAAADQLDEALVAQPFPLTAAPSRLLDHLRARCAGLDLQVIAPRACRWPQHLALLHGALHRPATVADLRLRLRAAAVAGPGAALPAPQRAALLGEATACFADACGYGDALLLAGAAGPGAGAGLRLDAFSELLYRRTADVQGDAAWVGVLMSALDSLKEQATTVARMRITIAALPWATPEAAAQAARAAWADWGTTASTLVLAEACAEHGQAALADELRQRVLTLYRHLRQYSDRLGLDRDAREYLEFRLLSAGVLSPATVPAAIAAGEAFARRRTSAQEWDSVQLALALAYLAADRRDDALAALVRSFVVGRTDTGMNYWCDGELVTEAAPCRTWILRRLLAAKPLGAAQRQQLLAELKPALIDDAFAGLLGLERGKLPADPHAAAASANDF